MSHEKICKHCGFANPYSSKFCNNCGEKLPLGTHIICPDCSAANAHDRVFCDECGTRLIPDTAKPEEPKPKEPAAGPGAFTLPARKPGETGDLDPLTLPDWLRTGETEPVDASPPEDLPPVEELKPEKDKTGDLPDWLVHESKPIIHAPTVISTELYRDLIENSEDSPQPDDLLESAGEANLPDWLAEPESEPEAEPESPAPPPVDPAVPSPEPSPVKTEPPAQPAADEIEAPDWLTETDPGSAAIDDSLTSWLFDLETAPAAKEGDESADLSQGLTEWLEDSGELLPEDAETGLTGLFLDASEELEPPVAPAAEQDLTDEEISDGLTGWLTELEDETSPAAEETAVEETSGLTDWLTSLDEPTEATAVPSTEEPAPATEAAVEPDLAWLDEPEPTEPEIIEPADTLLAAAVVTSEAIPEKEPESEPETEPVQEAEPVQEPEPKVETEAELAPELFISEEDIEEAEDEFARLFAEEPEEELPEWLMTAELEGESLVAETAEDDFVDEDALPDAADLDWTADLVDSGVLAAASADEEETNTPRDADEEPDWLADLAAISTGQLIIEAQDSEPELPEPEALDAEPEEEAIVEDTAVSEPPLSLLEEPESSLEAEEWAMDTLFGSDAEADEMPEWLSQLDDTAEITDDTASDIAEPPPIATDEELPDWISSMRPSEAAMHDSSLPEVLTPESELPDAFEDIPDDLAGGELPDWLQDVALAGAAAAATSDTDDRSEIPDWLQAGDEETLASGELADAASGDWQTMLDDLPEAQPMAEQLAKADIPEWVQALKPVELSGESRAEPQGPEEKSGPLRGLHGVVPVASLLIQPHETTTAVEQFTVSKEQQEQAALLRQLSREEPAQIAPVAQTGSQSLSAWLRVLLALVLIAAVILGLRGANFINKSVTAVPEPISGVHTAVTDAAGQTVLVAFEYTPSLAGELTPEAHTLLAQLEENQSRLLVISQYTSGSPIAAELGEFYDAENLGYLPGNAVSLRQLSDCMTPGAACQTLAGQPVSTEASALLEDVALIIVFTGRRESLVNWVEQVGSQQDIPLVAGVTQGLAPSAEPYYLTGQLNGVLAGMPGTAVYQQAYTDKLTKPVNQEFNALIITQILAAIFLVIGAIMYGITGITAKKQAKQA